MEGDLLIGYEALRKLNDRADRLTPENAKSSLRKCTGWNEPEGEYQEIYKLRETIKSNPFKHLPSEVKDEYLSCFTKLLPFSSGGNCLFLFQHLDESLFKEIDGIQNKALCGVLSLSHLPESIIDQEGFFNLFRSKEKIISFQEKLGYFLMSIERYLEKSKGNEQDKDTDSEDNDNKYFLFKERKLLEYIEHTILIEREGIINPFRYAGEVFGYDEYPNIRNVFVKHHKQVPEVKNRLDREIYLKVKEQQRESLYREEEMEIKSSLRESLIR